MPTRPIRMIAVLLAAVAMLAACGEDADDASEDDTTSTSDAAVDSAPADKVTVTAVDFDFEGLPRSIPAGSQLELVNEAPKELHELVAIHLPTAETRSAEELMALPEAELGALLGTGPPAAVLLAPPGGPQIPAVGDGTLTEPGRYLMFCAIPTGVDPAVYLDAVADSQGAPPQVEGGPPHFVAGMFAELTVEARS